MSENPFMALPDSHDSIRSYLTLMAKNFPTLVNAMIIYRLTTPVVSKVDPKVKTYPAYKRAALFRSRLPASIAHVQTDPSIVTDFRTFDKLIMSEDTRPLAFSLSEIHEYAHQVIQAYAAFPSVFTNHLLQRISLS